MQRAEAPGLQTSCGVMLRAALTRPCALLRGLPHVKMVGNREPLAHANYAAMDQQLHRSLAIAHDLANLGKHHVLTELEGQRGALVWGQILDSGPRPRRLRAFSHLIGDGPLRIGNLDCC